MKNNNNNKHTPLKDLRVLAGRAEASITALKLGIDTFDGDTQLMKERATRLAALIRELRQQIEDLV